MMTPDALIASPQWLAHRYDPQHDAVHFIDVAREARAAVPFLTDAELKPPAPPVVVRRSDLGSARAAARPVHFVFHSAYCGSTLLANALDLPGIASTLKEPVLLNDMVGWRHRGGKPADIQRVLDHGLDLLARPFEPDTAMIVKPSNVVNALIPAMLTLRPDAHALLLHAPLDVFVASIAGKGLWGRAWVRDLLAKQLRDGVVDIGLDAEAIFLLTDLQAAATGWLVQHKLFAGIARRFPDRVRTLDSEVMLERRAQVGPALAAMYGLGSAAGDAIAKAPAFTRNSKDGRPFDFAARKTRRAEAVAAHRDEIEKVVIWAQAVADGASVPLDLPAPLLA
jgi:hypothetical protein